MALLGAQLVITLSIVSVIQKLSPYFSFARWILCSTGLKRHLYPTNQELKNLAGISREKSKKGKHENGKINDTFQIPRNLDITLETAKVTPLDVVHLKFYSDFQWLFDFSVYTSLVYVITEIYNYWYPNKDEMNLSMLWCSLVTGFAFKILVTLWVQYFKGDESVGERSTCIVTGFAYLLVAMIVLVIDDEKLEIGVDKGYFSFNKSASTFLENQGLSSTGPASMIIVKFFLALWCGFLGSLFTFPGMRMSKMHWDTLKRNNSRKILLLLANISYALPLLLVSLWIKPISRDYLTVRIFSGMNAPLMTPSAFESMRIVAIVVFVLLRIALMPMYLQCHLDLATERLETQKKEVGRISNVEFQKKIAAVFYYLCVVALQYIAPLLILLNFALMYKTLGVYSWNGFFKDSSIEECPANEFPQFPSEITSDGEKTIAQTAQDLQFALNSLQQVFTIDVSRGALGLATWWSCFAIFATSAMGMLYQTYFSNV